MIKIKCYLEERHVTQALEGILKAFRSVLHSSPQPSWPSGRVLRGLFSCFLGRISDVLFYHYNFA